MTRMKINLESAGMTLINYADIAIQTLPVRKEKRKSRKQHIPSSNIDTDKTWSKRMIDNQFAEDNAVIRPLSLQTENESESDETDLVPSTKSSVFAEQQKSDGVEETVYDEIEQQVSSQSSDEEDKTIDDEFAQEKEDEDQNQFSDTKSSAARNTKLENKVTCLS